jgi:hypothetical protein
MELKMLFCQQKNVKRVTAVTGIVIMSHFFAVWFVCLKTVIHHFAIPLSGTKIPLPEVRIRLNKSAVAVAKQTNSHVKSQNTQSVLPRLNKAKPPVKEAKAVAKKAVVLPAKKTKSAEKKGEKIIEPKKPIIKETQKRIESKEVVLKKEVPTPVINETKQITEPILSYETSPSLIAPQEQESLDSSNEVNTVNYYDVVYKTITDQWRPPIGIVKGTSCTVSFMIDQKGLPVDVVFEKKSGVLMFDISIKTVLVNSTFSSFFVGNRFSIVFTV